MQGKCKPSVPAIDLHPSHTSTQTCSIDTYKFLRVSARKAHLHRRRTGAMSPPAQAHQYMHMYTQVYTHIQTYFMYRHSNLGIWRNSRDRLNVQSTIKKHIPCLYHIEIYFWRTLMPQICTQHTRMTEAHSAMIPLIQYLKHAGVVAIRSPIHPCHTHTNR